MLCVKGENKQKFSYIFLKIVIRGSLKFHPKMSVVVRDDPCDLFGPVVMIGNNYDHRGEPHFGKMVADARPDSSESQRG